jgi:hypothetical protein
MFDNAGYAGAGAGLSGRTYDVSPDGQRFLLVKEDGLKSDADPPSVVVVLNWFGELKRLAGDRN